MKRLRCCMSIGPDAASNDKDRLSARLTAAPAETELRGQPAKGKGPDRRLSPVDRRYGADRRQASAEQADACTGPERRAKADRRDTGLERRRGPGRRLADERRSAEEGEM